MVIGYTQFEKIPLSPERQRAIIQQQIDDMIEGIDMAKRDGDEQFTIKQMETMKKRMQARLESLFIKFNLKFPADYRARSMSVSDVVVLHENDVDKAYFCDPIGFVEVPQFLQADRMVTMGTTGLAVDGHFGTWHTIDTKKIGGQDFYLMEHDEFTSEVAAIVVDGTGKVLAEDVWNGFSPEILSMIAVEQCLILLHPTSVNEANYLFAAEGYSEENYNMIDGRIATQSKLIPGDDTESQPERSKGKRPSVLEKLKEKQAEIPAKSKADISPTRSSDNIFLD